MVNNASALPTIKEEVKGDGMSITEELQAELENEKRRNAELMERISILEAQLEECHKQSLLPDEQGGCACTIEKGTKVKRKKLDPPHGRMENGEVMESKSASQTGCEDECTCNINLENGLVNWMSMDGRLASDCKKSNDVENSPDTDEKDTSPDKGDTKNHIKASGTKENQSSVHKPKEDLDENVLCKQMQVSSSDGAYHCKAEPCFTNVNQEMVEYQKINNVLHEMDACHVPAASLLHHKKLLKVAFCPKEVRRIFGLDVLSQRNAQSHTIRKIIVFASLGIKHGCEDMYELDFNHFNILRKGEPYVSPKDPGEHVLYENPGVRRKVFYPNRQNPTLCPVQILEDEEAMRPSDASCPTHFFLCIKYGGTTRNIPQNEYVRQRMGKNKLKSFGPLMCKMAGLLRVRGGSFFFKALGITLLFMAGFPDEMVRKETKYQNMDLIKKYYRTDEDAGAEKLFLECLIESTDHDGLHREQMIAKIASTKFKQRRQNHTAIKSQHTQRSSSKQSAFTSCAPSFGLTGCNSSPLTPISKSQEDMSPISNPSIKSFSSAAASCIPAACRMFPPQLTNNFIPMMYWPSPNSVPAMPRSVSYDLCSFQPTANYISFRPHPSYAYPPSDYTQKKSEATDKNELASEKADGDSNSSSSSS